MVFGLLAEFTWHFDHEYKKFSSNVTLYTVYVFVTKIAAVRQWPYIGAC